MNSTNLATSITTISHTPSTALAPSDPATETPLGVRIATAEEHYWFDQQLADQHYLGAGLSVGDYLRQTVEVRSAPVAMLVLGPACYALKDRDRWIGWSANHRLKRLKLIV